MIEKFLEWLRKFIGKQPRKTHMYDIQQLVEDLKQDEGVVYKIYRDHLGNPTFGVGHLVTKNDPEWGQPIGTSVSEDRVWEAFDHDLQSKIRSCEIMFGDDEFYSYPATVQEILINQMFNMGRPRFSTFVKYQAALRERNWKKAAHEGRDSLWYKQVPNRAERLMTRLENVREK